MSTTTMSQTTQVYQLFIKASPEQIWEAITKPEFTERYFYGSVIDSTFEPGSPYRGWAGDRSRQHVDGEVLEADRPRLLEHAQVLHHAEARHRKPLLERRERLAVLGEQLVEQAPARRVGESLEPRVHGRG